MAVTCRDSAVRSKESGPVSIKSTLRLFDVSHGVNEKRELQIYFSPEQFNLANWRAPYNSNAVILQSSKAAQVTEIRKYRKYR